MVAIVEEEVRLLSAETGIEAIDPRVLDAMRIVPRHDFVPVEIRAYAYNNHPLPIGHGQNIAAPLLIALMTHLAELEPDDAVFETGTGAGYHAALLSRLVRNVFSVEVIEPLAAQAARLLKEHHGDNVMVQAGDGYDGWPAHAPYDAIILKESLDHIPLPLIHQLKPGGRLVMPLGPADGAQDLIVIRRTADGRITQKRIMPVRFSPMQGGERL
ncbi:MAG: protein-L-isoaspartate(D-aspartate) O-methyltransferase [Rhizobiales bacterium]|nr:protein-L-isoaspartate(D-aspartate) O-methyltransferase [Hyphomicrobiales bacterium]